MQKKNIFTFFAQEMIAVLNELEMVNGNSY